MNPSAVPKSSIIDETGVKRESVEKVIEIFMSGVHSKSRLISRAFNSVIHDEDVNPTVAWNDVVRPIYTAVFRDNRQRSWRSASGSAFQNFVMEYYNHRLPDPYRVNNYSNREIENILNSIEVDADGSRYLRLAVETYYKEKWSILGFVHVHTSLRDRISRIRELSRDIQSEYMLSLVVTLDTQNELGKASDDEPVANRELIELSSAFSNMYCYNTDVEPTIRSGAESSIKSVDIPADTDVFVKDVKSFSMKMNEEVLLNHRCEELLS